MYSNNNNFWPGVMKISADAAREYLRHGVCEIFELSENETLAKINSLKTEETKIYCIENKNLSFTDFLTNEYNLFGYALLCRGTNNILKKITVAYDFLCFLLPNLRHEQKEQCQFFINLMQEKFALHDNQNLRNELATDQNKELIELWDDITIYLQNVCPPDWYFVRKENYEYRFVFIPQK